MNNCNNAIYFPFTSTWFTSEQYEKNHKKEFEVAHLCGKLLKTHGQSLRHELLARKNEIKIPNDKCLREIKSHISDQNLSEINKNKISRKFEETKWLDD